MSVSLTVQILAMGLTISQLIVGKVESFRTSFDPQTDGPLVSKLFLAGCAEGLKDPDTGEPLDIDPFLQEFAKDASSAPNFAAPGAKPNAADALSAKIAKFDFKALRSAYRQLCKSEAASERARRSRHPRVKNRPDTVGPAVDLAPVIAFYNESFKGLPDVRQLKDARFQQLNLVLDHQGERVADMYKADNRRRFVPFASIPPHVVQAFVSAEDKEFWIRKMGVDMKGIMRAAVSSMTAGEGKRAAGGSTIPQQTIKNYYRANDYTFGRKMREMYMATLAQIAVSDKRMMEIYLNEIPLGRDTRGVEMAAQVYFGKPVAQLTISEAAYLAGINKGPNYYNPDKGADRLKLIEDRRLYVLKRMAEDAVDVSLMRFKDPLRLRAHRTSAPKLVAEINKAKTDIPKVIPVEPASNYYFVDQINRQIRFELKKTEPALADYDQGGYIIHSTIDPKLQLVAEMALQDGLAEYESSKGRAVFTGRVGSIAKRAESRPWQELMVDVKAETMRDVHWPLAVVLPTTPAPSISCGKNLVVGLKGGGQACLDAGKADVSKLLPYDLVFAKPGNAKAKTVTLMIPPTVQGATVILQNRTGRVMGMVGGFSYGASQLNRATMTMRQPGSTIKPFTYLYALNQDYQPNTMVSDVPRVIPSITPGGKTWSPNNYDRASGGSMTLRMALENSVNVATANTMASIPPSAAHTLDEICNLTKALGIYDTCVKNFPFILGAQETSLIKMAAAYATIANLGFKPTPYFLDGIERNGQMVWPRPTFKNERITIADQVSFYQLRRMLEGVVQNGTAKALAKEFGAQRGDDSRMTAGLLGAKTGTSQGETDVWFIGFTNEYTVATWVGYDNKETRRTLGRGQTGGSTAMPIAVKILRYIKQTQGIAPLRAPPKAIRPLIGEQIIDAVSGKIDPKGDLLEIFRLNYEKGDGSMHADGNIIDSRDAFEQANLPRSNNIKDGDERSAGPEDGTPEGAGVATPAEPKDDHYQIPKADPYEGDDRMVDPGYEAIQRQYQQGYQRRNQQYPSRTQQRQYRN